MRKKIIVFLTLVLLVSCMALCACGKKETGNKQPATYTVTYAGEGVTSFSRSVNKGETAIEPKDPEREGFTFDFWYLEGQTQAYDFSTPVNSDITLLAHWTEAVQPETWTYLNWNGGNFAEFLIDGISGSLPSKIISDNTVSFTLRISPYCKGEAVVKAGDKVLTPDGDGWYEFITEGSEMVISVTGLVNDNTPITGVGTQNDPYVLYTPANFKYFADSVNNVNSSKFNSSYVVLANDISFNGEEIEPIGDTLNVTHFSGVFDGQGHTISDYTMKGKEGLGGLFGYIVTASVVNVHVKNAVYNIDTTSKFNYIVGGIAAYSMGSDVFGCSFDGEISLGIGDSTLNSFVGGIVGFVQGYSTEYSATIAYSSANVQFNSTGNIPLFAVGGIAGSIYGASTSSPTNIYNCTANVGFDGTIALAGGIVGYMRTTTSVANCFSSGSVISNNDKGDSSAGALIGLAETETAVTNSYSTASVTKKPIGNDVIEGTVRGDLVGSAYLDGTQTESLYNKIDCKSILIYNTYLAEGGKITANGNEYDVTDFDSIKTLLKWNDSEWTADGGKPVCVVAPDGEYGLTYTVTVNMGGKVTADITESVSEVPLTGYIPLGWLYSGDGKNTFKATDGSISYGYFLDEQKTVRLPSAMLLTTDITIYIGFEDYSAVNGEYYLDVNGKTAKLVFDSNGMMLMIYNGMEARYMYVYDGDKIYIKDGYFAYMFYTSDAVSSLITDFYAYKEGTSLTICDNFFFNATDKYLHAYCGNAVMGEWYDRNGNKYTFNLDGSGKKVSENLAEVPFTYTIEGKDVVMYILGDTYQAKLSDDGRKIESVGSLTLSICMLDKFEGEWETDFNNLLKVSFDGMGTMAIDGTSYAYTVNPDGLIEFEGGTAKVNDEGYIDLQYGDKSCTLCRTHSYRGFWEETLYNYTVTLEGITIDGYGYGVDSNGVTFTYRSDFDGNVTEGTDGYSIYIYYRTTIYGMGNYALDKDRQEFLFYAVYDSSVGGLYDNYNLCCHDPLSGDWNTADGRSFTFNGLGAYDKNATYPEGLWVAQGNVTITTNGVSETVRYTYDRTLGKAQFTYANSAYIVTVDVAGNPTISIDGKEEVLYGKDALNGITLGGGGYKFTFDGSSPSGNGKVIVTTPNVNEEVHPYTYDGTTVKIYNGDTEWLTITQSENYMTLGEGASAVKLGIYTLMSGKTYLFASGDELTIGVFDLTGVGTGDLSGEEVSLVYHSDRQVAIYYEGELLYVLVYQNENNAALYDTHFELITMICVNDGYKGVYTQQNGDSITLDGRGLVMGYYSSANMQVGEEKFYYYYSLNDDGTLTIFALDRSGEEDVVIPKYKVYSENTDGAVKYTSADGKEIYVVKVAE